MEKVRRAYKEDNCHSQSEFIERAIEFYWGYLTEELAVEMSMTMHVLASQSDIGEENLKRLQGYCVEEVKRINGKISFDRA